MKDAFAVAREDETDLGFRGAVGSLQNRRVAEEECGPWTVGHRLDGDCDLLLDQRPLVYPSSPFEEEVTFWPLAEMVYRQIGRDPSAPLVS